MQGLGSVIVNINFLGKEVSECVLFIPAPSNWSFCISKVKFGENFFLKVTGVSEVSQLPAFT